MATVMTTCWNRTLEVMVRTDTESVHGRRWDLTAQPNVSVQNFMEKHKLDEVICRVGTTLVHYRWAASHDDRGR